jgi:hypothetical protein
VKHGGNYRRNLWRRDRKRLRDRLEIFSENYRKRASETRGRIQKVFGYTAKFHAQRPAGSAEHRDMFKSPEASEPAGSTGALRDTSRSRPERFEK